MNDRQVSSFVWAATLLNFHRAAERLHVTQPALSYQVQSLERELGFELFVRDRKTVQLTPAGRHLYEGLLQVQTLLDRTLEECRAEAAGGRRELLVSWPAVICSRQIMLDLVAAFGREEPDVAVDIAVSDTINTFGVEDGRQVDVVITLHEDVEHLRGWLSFPLFEEVVSCVVAESHPLATAKSVTVDMLRSQTVLLMLQNSYLASYKRLVDQLLADLPRGAVRFLGSNSEIEMNVASGRGVSLRPVRQDVLRAIPGCVAVPLEPTTVNHVTAAYTGDDPEGLKRRFCKFAQEYCAGL